MLQIQDLSQSKLRSSSLDKLHGQKKALDLTYSGDKVYSVSEDSTTEAVRKKLESITGKSIYVIDKGSSFVGDFIDDLEYSNPTEVIDLGDFKEVKFKDFSLYHEKSGWWRQTFMDAKEIILPPKSIVEKGQKRLYILYVGDKYLKLPELEYPKIIVQFIKWAKKKKKLTFAKADDIWNHSNNVVLVDKNSYPILHPEDQDTDRIDWYRTGLSCDGYPARNIKTEDDLVAYNNWLLGDYKKLVEKSNAAYKKAFKGNSGWKWEMNVPIPGKLDPTEITTITQDDVDQFISEVNNRYKVSR